MASSASATYQLKAVVLGVEGDFSGGEVLNSAVDGAGFTHWSYSSWTSTIAARLGYAVENVLFHGKGGIAFAQERETVSDPRGNGATSGSQV